MNAHNIVGLGNEYSTERRQIMNEMQHTERVLERENYRTSGTCIKISIFIVKFVIKSMPIESVSKHLDNFVRHTGK